MWVVSTRGFYSVVQHLDHPDTVLIRARSRADLDRLVALADAMVQPIGEIEATPHADYPYRLTAYRHVWQVLLVALADEIDYPNFKTAVAVVNRDRADTYHGVWQVLHDIEDEPDAMVLGGNTEGRR